MHEPAYESAFWVPWYLALSDADKARYWNRRLRRGMWAVGAMAVALFAPLLLLSVL